MDKLQEKLQQLLPEDIQIYELQWKKDMGMKILEITLISDTRVIDLDICSDVSTRISTYLDDNDIYEDEYYLEVASAGAERAIRTKDELINSVSSYIYVEFNEEIKGKLDAKGTLESYNDGVFTLQYMDKAAKRKLQFKYDDVRYVRYSVKI